MSSTPRFLFLHVMKAGGTSFVFHLLREFPAHEIYPSAALDRRHPTDVEPYGSIPDLASVTPQRHGEIRMYTGHFPYMVREVIGGDLRVLTLLRDPVDRTVSVLKQFKRLYPRYRDLPLEAVYEDPFVLRHFVENHQTKIFSVTLDDRPKMLASKLDYRQVFEYLSADAVPADEVIVDTDDTITIDAERLARAKVNLARVDVVGLNERFDEFVAALHGRFGWWPAGIAGDARANVSREPWKASRDLRRRIARDNAFDLEFYEYAKELAQ
jgi:hypothetical protein